MTQIPGLKTGRSLAVNIQIDLHDQVAIAHITDGHTLIDELGKDEAGRLCSDPEDAPTLVQRLSPGKLLGQSRDR